MAADVKWIKVYTDMVSNKKIKRIRTLPEGNNIVLIWVFLLAQAGESNKSGALYLTDTLPFTPEDLAIEFDFEIPVIKFALITLEKYSMIEIFDEVIYIKNWGEYQNIEGMEKIREQTRLRNIDYRERKKQLLLNDVKRDVTVTVGDGTELELELEKDKEKKTKVYTPDESEILSLWNSKGIIIHNESEPLKKEIAKALKKPGKEKVIHAITQYSILLHDADFYYSNKFTLANFLKQGNGLPNFLDDGQIWTNYIARRGKGGFNQKPVGQIASGEAESDEEWPISNHLTR